MSTTGSSGASPINQITEVDDGSQEITTVARSAASPMRGIAPMVGLTPFRTERAPSSSCQERITQVLAVVVASAKQDQARLRRSRTHGMASTSRTVGWSRPIVSRRDGRAGRAVTSEPERRTTAVSPIKGARRARRRALASALIMVAL